MNIKKFLSFVISAVMISSFSVAVVADAATYTRLVDNDPSAAGNSFSCYNMTYYSGQSGSYNSDMRLSPTIYNNSADAQWEYPQIHYNQSSCSVTLNVYLNHANFTDPAAQYTMQVDVNGVGKYVGYINQKYAPAGWSSISKTITAYASNSYITSGYIYVQASNGSNKRLGADAINLQVVF